MAGSMVAAFASVGLEMAMVQQAQEQAKREGVEDQVHRLWAEIVVDARPADTLNCALFLAEREWEHETDPDHEDLAFYSTLGELTSQEANVLGRAIALYIATTDDFGNVKALGNGKGGR